MQFLSLNNLTLFSFLLWYSNVLQDTGEEKRILVEMKEYTIDGLEQLMTNAAGERGSRLSYTSLAIHTACEWERERETRNEWTHEENGSHL